MIDLSSNKKIKQHSIFCLQTMLFLFLTVLETVTSIDVIHRSDRALRHHKHLATSTWNQLQHSRDINNAFYFSKSDINVEKINTNEQEYKQQFRRNKRGEDDIPYVGKGRIKPYRLPVTQETTTQTGMNKRIPKYFLNSNSSTIEPAKRLSNIKKKNEKARSGYADISELNKNRNLTSEIFGDKKKSISGVTPRAIVKGGKNRNRVLKGQKPRKQGAKFNSNNVARGKIKKRRKSTRGTTRPTTISSTISETMPSEVSEITPEAVVE